MRAPQYLSRLERQRAGNAVLERQRAGGMQCAPGPWILSFEGWVGNVARPKYGIFMYTLLNYIRILNRSAGCATHVACYEHIFYEQDDNARAGS